MANKLELTNFSDAELQDEVKSMQAEYHRAQFEHATKSLANPMELRAQRRDIARMLTEVRRREVVLMTPEQLSLRTKIRARRKK